MPTLTVTGPAAGAAFYARDARLAIAWTSNLPPTSPVAIELSRDGGGSRAPGDERAQHRQLPWVATGPSTARRSPASRSAVPDRWPPSGTFAIVVPSLTVTGPAAGAAFYAGTTAGDGLVDQLAGGAAGRVELSRDGGGTFETLAAAAPNTGSFAWVVTGPDAAAAFVRVTVTDPVAASGASGAFAIVTPVVTVTGPATGALAYAGTPVTIAWTTTFPTSIRCRSS